MIKVKCTSKEGYNLIQFADDDATMHSVLVEASDLGLPMYNPRVVEIALTDSDIAKYENAIIRTVRYVLRAHQMDEIKSFKVQLDSVTQPEYLKTNAILRKIYEFDIARKRSRLNSNYVESEYVATQNKEAIKIADLNTECIKLYAHNRGLRLDIHRFTERNKKLEAESQRKDGKIKELEAKCADHSDTASGVRFDTFIAKKQIKNKDSEINKLKSEVAKLKAEAQAKDNSISTLQHIVDDYTAGTVALKVNDDKIKGLEAECASLTNENDDLRTDNENINDINNELNRDINDLKCREKVNRKFIQRLRDDLKELRSNCDKLTNKNDELTQCKVELNDEIDALNKMTDGLNNMINDLRGRLSWSTKHMEFLRAELNSSRCKYNKLNDENKHLKRNMKSSEDDPIDHKTPETNISESKYDKLIEEHEHLKRKMKAFGTWWLGKYRARIKRCAELEGTIVSLESQLAVESQECTRLRDELEASKR